MSRGYCFTWNNYTEEDVEFCSTLISLERPKVRYVVFGKEIAPTTNTPHLQGYIYFESKIKFDSVRKLLKNKCHIEVQRGTIDEAVDYCKEDGDFMEFGTKPVNGKRTDLDAVYDKIKSGVPLEDVILEDPNVYNYAHRAMHKLEDIQMRKRYRNFMTEGEWVYGPTGVGKSEYAFSNMSSTYVYPYDNSGWCDGYKQEEIFVLDEFRGQIPFNELLRMVDKHPNYSLKRRGREPIPFLSKKVIVTSSMHPREVFKNLSSSDSLAQLYRRFKIFRIDENGLHEETLASALA